MGGIKKSLFGSKDTVTNTPAQLYPASQTQTDLQKQLYDSSTGILNGAANNYNTGTGLLSQAASGQLSGDTAANLQNQAMDLYDQQVGSVANNMAFNNLGSNTMTQNALSKASSDASDWYMNNYLNALQTQGNLANSLASQGLSGTRPAGSLYSGLLGQQTALSTPAQQTVKKGSGGLFGSALSGWASGGFK
jgi:hypothetical protein